MVVGSSSFTYTFGGLKRLELDKRTRHYVKQSQHLQWLCRVIRVLSPVTSRPHWSHFCAACWFFLLSAFKIPLGAILHQVVPFTAAVFLVSGLILTSFNDKVCKRACLYRSILQPTHLTLVASRPFSRRFTWWRWQRLALEQERV